MTEVVIKGLVNTSTQVLTGVGSCPDLLEKYSSILEKTNNQLSLWFNPYGLAVGILTCLIAFVAIGVSLALFLYSKEQKERFDEFLKKQEELIAAREKRSLEIEKKLQSLINAYEGQLGSATEDNKKEIRRAIDDLRREKESARAYIGYTGPGIQPTFGFSQFGVRDYDDFSLIDIKCPKCETNFVYKKIIAEHHHPIECPKCGFRWKL